MDRKSGQNHCSGAGGTHGAPRDDASHRLPPRIGWRSRGYLPHFDVPGLIQTLTFRLNDALPAAVLKTLMAELADLENETAREKRRRLKIEEYLDAGHGSCLLRDSSAAGIVQNALLHFDNEHYRLIAWCIMPNHVHVIIECFPDRTLASVLHSWKSFTAHAINKALNLTGPVWQKEYHDRFIRDSAHFQKALHYLEQNPVKAGLVTDKTAWPWSSAFAGSAVRPAGPAGSAVRPGGPGESAQQPF